MVNPSSALSDLPESALVLYVIIVFKFVEAVRLTVNSMYKTFLLISMKYNYTVKTYQYVNA